MTVSFFERLEARSKVIDSLLCVGLDPHPDDLRELSATAARDFCLRLMDATAPFAATYKPNSAFFEAFGADGIAALKEVIAHANKDIPVILDAKRGDIASTAQAYATAVFAILGADAVTASPYLGQDSIEPYIADPQHGVFLLCRTSNPGAGNLQDLVADGQPIYIHVARMAQQWNRRGNVGLVVGATYPKELAELRAQVEDLWFLSPGVGSQGADLEQALAAGLRADGLGMLIPVSRGISRAADPALAARQFRDQINAARQAKAVSHKPEFQNQQLAEDLLRLGCVQFGDFKLKSGQHSPIYLDLRRLVGDPVVLARVARAYVGIMRDLKFDRVAGLPYAALPIATAIALQGGWPLIYPRKEVKDYGTKSAVEGPFESGETALVIDDLITTGGSKLEGIEKLEAVGLRVGDIVVLIDRQSAGRENLRDGLQLHSVFRLSELLDHWHETNAIGADQHKTVSEFLSKN